MIIEEYNETKTEILRTIWKFNNSDKEYVTYFVVCKNPFCACTDITFGIRTDLNSSIIASFSYDIKKNKLKKIGIDQSSKVLSRQLFSECTSSDFKILRDIFYNEKTECTEACNVNEVEPPYFPVKEIEEESLMIFFDQVFPYVPDQWVLIDNISYFVSEQYCLNTICNCKNIIISFLGFCESKPIGYHETTSVSFDFETGKWEIIEQSKKYHNCSMLMAQLYKKYPDIKKTFIDRRNRLKVLYKRYKENIDNAESQNKMISTIKIGRNDPCSCGSGKKYKKCCGR